jgi:hypothetical protein
MTVDLQSPSPPPQHNLWINSAKGASCVDTTIPDEYSLTCLKLEHAVNLYCFVCLFCVFFFIIMSRVPASLLVIFVTLLQHTNSGLFEMSVLAQRNLAS